MVYYEIHHTVDVKDYGVFMLQAPHLGFKPIVIELDEKLGNKSRQVMTSDRYTFDGNYQEFIASLQDILKAKSEILENAGYTIARNKVEISPLGVDLTAPEVTYLESHIRFVLTQNTAPIFEKFCQDNNLHISRNVYKVSGDKILQIATLRTTNKDLVAFMAEIDRIKAGFQHDKIEVEACVYDSNEGLDRNWLN